MLSSVLAVLFFAPAFAATSSAATFTALGSDQSKYLYAALKQEKKGYGLTSRLVQIDAGSFKSRNVPLSPEMASREIRAVLASASEIFALTQWTTGEGDNPTLYVYDLRLRKWTLVGEVACPSFESFRSEAQRLVFKCEDETKNLNTGKFVLPVTAEVTPPQTRVETATLHGALEGQTPDWDKLQLKSGKKQTTLKAAQLVKTK